MGKRGGFRGGKRGGGRSNGERTNSWKEYPAVEKQHKNFQKFYDELLQLPEGEKNEFWEALRRELPNSFRFCGSKGHALAVKRLLETRYIPQITGIEFHDGRPVEPPKPVPWYPNDLAWWMTTPKNVIRKFPPFAAFQKFLVSETSVGNISRQEVVSMIPPMLMDVQPNHVVLDMCAAPGSKAAQLLEMIMRGEEARVRKTLRSFAQEDGLDLGAETQEEREADLEADPSDCGRSTGLLIANDSDYKRGHMLVHQLKRLSSPNLLVTNHDATQFPSIKIPNRENPKAANYLKFDRILADVPCSGDGTLRKNVNLWKDWQPGSALGLHLTQIRILVRALQLLKAGGKVVYSTCSMNPVENEAVVAAAIDRCGGEANVEIIDCSQELPKLKRYPGFRDWKIIDKNSRIWNSHEEVIKHANEMNGGVVPGRVVETMFPPAEGTLGYGLPLERCMRVYPHMQDTGGFFITVLQKKNEFKARNENEPSTIVKSEAAAQEPSEKQSVATATAEPKAPAAATDEPKAEAAAAETKVEVKTEDAVMDDAEGTSNKRPLDTEEQEQPSKKVKTEADSSAAVTPAAQPEKPRKGPIEEPFKYLDATHPIIQNIKEFYHLSTRFPDDRYMVRNEMGEPAKAIYYTTALMRDILTENEGRGIKFVHGGVRMYMKQDAPSAEVCRWRIQNEGIPILQGYVGEPRVVHLRNKETLRRLLIEMFPSLTSDGWKDFDEIGERVRDIGMGCAVLRVEPDGSDPDFTERMALPLWKSIKSLNLMLPKEDRAAMLLRVFNDTSPLINTTLKQQQEKKAAAQNGEQKKEEEDATVEPKAEVENDGAVKPEEAQTVEEQVAREDLPAPDETPVAGEPAEEAS
ncbi:putative methyltransferase [Emericellopsis atlantica]|uniref:Methyltransferase n=1 Tax=Emericellopsis atlantica TaxID=2614577 RepID=A0A9P8CUD3_9HYPO|nr:putative methyltransferase [Emericellopsis atlantica]KAG9258945.1 putative methyltransferase [Emericellopsis atlantica]